MNKIATINYQGKDYATVPARLIEFRQQNPRAGIETRETIHDDGSVTFKATIVKDRSDEYSATATGTARYTAEQMKSAKAFEKLETISVGRALSLMGYLNNGDVASTEEMEEFEASKMEKFAKQIDEAESVEQLMGIFQTMNAIEKKAFTEKLSAKKAELLATVKGGDKEKTKA